MAEKVVTPSRPTVKTEFDSSRMSDEEKIALIQAIGAQQDELLHAAHTRVKNKIWNGIGAELVKLGFNQRIESHLQDRWKYFKKKYKSVKDARGDANSGGAAVKWKFEEYMDAFLLGNPAVDFTASSIEVSAGMEAPKKASKERIQGKRSRDK